MRLGAQKADQTLDKCMRKKMTLWFVLALVAQLFALAPISVKIVQLSGEVKFRRGVEEKWETAANGMLLEESDTIMTLEAGEVALERAPGLQFRLSGNAILDISDLREITERELFLKLMSEKVGKLAPRSEKIPLRLGEVSAVRGEDKNAKPGTRAVTQLWQMETNAARALRAQHLLPNAALKLYRVQTNFPQRADCGEVSLELAQVYEALQQKGRARDEYEAANAQCREQQCEEPIRRTRTAVIAAALRRLQ